MLLNKLNKVLYQMININLILKLKMIKDIQFVIIYGILELLYQNIGKINNIKIQKEHKEIDQIEHWLCNKLTMRKKYQIRNIIIIH